MKVLVTGAAGFIGNFVAEALAKRGDDVVGLDNINDYYDVRLKMARLARLDGIGNFRFVKADLADRATISALFEAERFERVVHLAAQAGVRYSLQNPHAYVDSNLQGFINVLEGARHTGVGHLVFASSSSVYGANTTMPYSVGQNVDHPLSLYAATKKANELMAHTYAHLYRIPVSGLRFFTVYGPWGRPDMSPFLFTSRILKGEPIDIFNNGNHARDFTYIDDVTSGVVRVLDVVAEPDPDWSGARPDPASSSAPYRLYNIGNSQSVELMDFVAAIEAATGRTAEKRFLPMQPGDVVATCADVSGLEKATGWRPSTPIGEGIARFVAWYREFYGV